MRDYEATEKRQYIEAFSRNIDWAIVERRLREDRLDPSRGRRLAVSAQEVVRRDHTADGRTPLDAAMASMPIVVVQPGRQGRLPRERTGIGSAVGPLPQQRLDEALGFAVLQSRQLQLIR
jgi:hypothetical protein